MTGASGAEGAALPHPDDDELAAARAEPEAPAEGETPEATPAEEQPAAAAPAVEPEPIMIPKPRFDEVRTAGQRAVQEAAYWKGQADALAKIAASGGKANTPDITPEQEIEQIEAALVAKATDFDEGRTSLAEYKRFELQAGRRMTELRQAPVADTSGDRQDMRLEELTAALPERFPVLNDITRQEIDRVLPMARAALQFEGVDLNGGPRSDFLLRERVAQLAQTHFGKAAPAAAPTGQPDTTKAARDKLALAGRMAPNLATLTAGNRPADPMSDEKFKDMDADEWAALPDSTRHARLFGNT